MKKINLFFLCLLLIPLMVNSQTEIKIVSQNTQADSIPNVIVHKSDDGGLRAHFYGYKEVTYTPSSELNGPANLDCSGTGWTYCRVPSSSFSFDTPTRNNTSNSTENKAIENAINKIIEYSETLLDRGTLSGSKTFVLAVGSNEYYSVKGNWEYNKHGEGDLYIYIKIGNNLSRTK